MRRQRKQRRKLSVDEAAAQLVEGRGMVDTKVEIALGHDKAITGRIVSETALDQAKKRFLAKRSRDSVRHAHRVRNQRVTRPPFRVRGQNRPSGGHQHRYLWADFELRQAANTQRKAEAR